MRPRCARCAPDARRCAMLPTPMRRCGDEGLRFFTRMRQRNLHRPTIFTVGQYEPDRGTPAHAFGITNRVDELLNLLFDILERTRG